MRRIRVEYAEGPRGFSRWVEPIARGYMLACCDCGLVHEMQFRVGKQGVQFRARRAARYTQQERKRHRPQVVA